MRTIEYHTSDIRTGTILLVGVHTLRVTHVVFRLGRGLELFTSRAGGYVGPTLYPHPDETMPVLHMPSMSEDDIAFLRVTTSDYPWASVR